MACGRILDLLVAGILTALLALAAVANLEPCGRLAIAGRTVGDTCTFHRHTALNCPFCGTSRSMVVLFDGRIRDSLRFHPLGVCIASAFALTAVTVVIAAARRSAPVIETRVFSAVMVSLIVASLCLWTFDGLRRCWSPESDRTRLVE